MKTIVGILATILFLISLASCAPKVVATKDPFLRPTTEQIQVVQVRASKQGHRYTFAEYSSRRYQRMRENQAKLRKLPTKYDSGTSQTRVKNTKRASSSISPAIPAK